jgi:hypothetical protein
MLMSLPLRSPSNSATVGDDAESALLLIAMREIWQMELPRQHDGKREDWKCAALRPAASPPLHGRQTLPGVAAAN